MYRLRAARSVLSFLFLGALAVLPAAAGSGFWSPLGPDGASITALVVDPTGAVYAAAQRGGIYKSSNGGDTWGLLGRGTGSESILALAATPRSFGPIYAAGESGAVFKTVDGGGNWVRVWAGAPQPNGGVASTFSLATDSRRPDTLFAGTRQGVYRSTDGGVTWSRRGTLTGAVRSLANDTASGWLYAGVDGQGVFRSANQGGTWERISAGLPPNAFFFSLAFDPDRPRTLLVTTPAGLYRSTDRGGRWQPVAGTPDTSALAIAFQRGGRAYASFNGGIFYSSDSGATWRRSANLPGRTLSDPRSLAAGPDRVFVGLLGDPNGPGLYRSLDSGATFQPAVAGIQGLAVTTVTVAPSDPRTIYAAIAFNSLFKTTDGGAHWAHLPIRFFSFGFYPISDILVDPARPERVWLIGDFQPSVLRSDNGGATWVALGEPGVGFRAAAFDPRAPEALWAAGWQGVYHSDDGGVTWERRTAGLGSAFYLEEVQVDPSDPDVVYASGGEAVGIRPVIFRPVVFRSADGGVTWERRDAGLEGGSAVDFAVDESDPSTLYAVTTRLFRSTDAGLSWELAPGLGGFSYVTVATAPAGPGTPAAVYTAHQAPAGMVLRSIDRGETWRPLRFNLQPAIPLVLEVDPSDLSHLLLGTQNRSLLTYTVGGSAQ